LQHPDVTKLRKVAPASSSNQADAIVSAATPSAIHSSSSGTSGPALEPLHDGLCPLPSYISWTPAADSVAISEIARHFALAAARGMFRSEVNAIFQHLPMSLSATNSLFASLLSVFTSIKRVPVIECVWWNPLVHSCSLDGNGLVFEESVLRVLCSLVADRLAAHFQVNEVWKAKQSLQWCAYVQRCLRILRQLQIFNDVPDFHNLKHTDANEWEKVQREVKRQSVAGIESMARSVVNCFQRSLACQSASSASTGTQCVAQRDDNGLWSIRTPESPAPDVEIHDTRLQRMRVAFARQCDVPPADVKFFEAVYACLLRYESTLHCASGCYGHHFGIPSRLLPSIIGAASANHGASPAFSHWIDCFSSPMTMLEHDLRSSQPHSDAPARTLVKYCSPYPDTDSCFGSLGSFFDMDFQALASQGNIMFLHPPNDAFVLQRVSSCLKDMFVDHKSVLTGIYVFPMTKSLSEYHEAFQPVSVWKPISAPVFCSGHPRDDTEITAVARMSDCDYRVGSISCVSDLHVMLPPVSLFFPPVSL
jgi:hypothetical protein